MKTILTLMRHAETEWNANGRWQGHEDVPLNANGRAQAAAAAPYLKSAGFSRIFTSDLARAYQTATIVNEALHLPMIIDPRLREINVGNWQGMTVPEIQSQFPELFAKISQLPYGQTYFPGGESRVEMMERAGAALTDLATKHLGECLLVVSHGGTIRGSMLHLAGMEQSEKIENCTLTRFVYNAGTWHIDGAGIPADKFVL